MPELPAERLRIGLVGNGTDASIWRALLSQSGHRSDRCGDAGLAPAHDLDLMLVFAESVQMATAAEACAGSAQPPSGQGARFTMRLPPPPPLPGNGHPAP